MGTHHPSPLTSIMSPKRVLITTAAAAIVDRLQAQHGPLMFHQSGGCCDGSAPMCFPVGEFYLGQEDVQLGEIHGCPFYMSRDQFEYWKHTELTIDVVEGRGASFSAEIPLGLRFVVVSRLFAHEEYMALEPVTFG